MKKDKIRKIIKDIGISIGAFALTFLMILTQIFYGWDKSLSDILCQTGEIPDSNIYILAIDDKTLEKYGPMSQWSRDISKELVEVLNQDEQKKPAVIGFDIMYIEKSEAQVDADFAEACAKADNVVVAMNLQFKMQPEYDENGNVFYNDFFVQHAEYPFSDLKEAADYGFANTIVDEDGYVRRSIAKAEFEGEEIHSLAITVYEKYMEQQNSKVIWPKLDENHIFGFKYAAEPGSGYSVISLCDVLERKVNPAMFAGGIVMVGAYAVGMQDSYVPAITHGQQMFGVEVQANLVNALIAGYTVTDAPLLPIALLSALIVAVFVFVARKMNNLVPGIIMVVLGSGYLFFVKMMFDKGYVLPILVLPLMLVISYIASVVEGYIKEIKRRRAIVGVFKQYVAPQIVDEISRRKEFKVTLGGEKRHIAVLFVDIRGFTTMSESLQPEQVVEILNEYLALTTDSIFKNSGTLDKFVGDATMAVFNAPFDLDDYVYRAVKTAWDMKKGADALAVKFEERFGKCVAFGIGVNCGEAIVGNIGCDFRMDYTAIGDIVNTAARLESRAARGQILISKEVYESVKDRVEVTPIGVMELKGKEQGVFVYQVDEVRV